MNHIFKIIYCISLIIFIIPKSLFASNAKAPIVIITVDVETTQYGNHSLSLPLPEQVNAVCMNDVPCGLQIMVNLLKKYDYSATFFFNPYEYKKHGEQSIMEIAKWLDESGQDVQLHTHPQWAYDEKRNFMYQYSLEEQVEIVRNGKELLERWIGKPIIAHRAGAYSADENTLRALISNNILYDSSLFIASPNSKISSLDLAKNTLSLYGFLYEFPVTVYEKNEYPPYFMDNIKPIERFRKYDVDSFVDEREVDKAINQIIEQKVDFMVLFLHSFSFIKEYDDVGDMKVDMNSLEIFEYILKSIHEKNLSILTFRDIKNNKVELEQYIGSPDTIPEISVRISAVQYLRKRIGINRDNYKIFAGVSGFAVLLIVLLSVNLKRKRN